VAVVDQCDAPGTPPAVQDVLIFSRGSFHLLAAGPISSGLLFLMAQMDAAPTAALRRDGKEGEEGGAESLSHSDGDGNAGDQIDSEEAFPLSNADAPQLIQVRDGKDWKGNGAESGSHSGGSSNGNVGVDSDADGPPRLSEAVWRP
jgi:hypothetical protein